MLSFSFFLSTFILILQAVLLPQVSFLPFSPFLALVILRCPLDRALWLAAFAGIVMDLISNDPVGVHALNYVIVSALLFRLKKHFLHDEPFHLSLFTAILSSLSTFFQFLLLFLFDRRVPFIGKWMLADLLGMPAIDGLIAYVWFAAPLMLFSKFKRWWDLFWMRRKRLSRTSR